MQISMLESLRGHGNGKNYEMGGKIIFQCFCVLSLNYCITPKHLRSPELCARSIKHLNCLTKLLHSLTKHLNFLTKVMHFPKKLCAPLQNFCVLSQNTVLSQKYCTPRETFARSQKFHSLAKVLHSPKKQCISMHYLVKLLQLCVHLRKHSNFSSHLILLPSSADPRLLGALRKTVSGGGGREWMRRICPCFTPSRIALVESARETVSLPRLV